MDYTIEKSQEEAKKLQNVQREVLSIDSEYLESALKDMRANHEMRESMAVLNPNPLTHNEQQDLNNAKLELLEIIIKMKKAMLNVADCHGKLMRAKGHEGEMSKLFGNFF